VQATFIDITDRKKTFEKLQILNEKLGVVGGLTRHDVRNKLSAVVNNTYLAQKMLPNDHKALDYLRKIESACIQTTRILDFAAAYEGLGVEELAPVDVDKAVEEAVSLFSELKGVKVVNNCQGLTVMADSALRQLFFNLIENSLKHGKNVSQIKIHYEEGKDRLKLFYEDNGVGIPKADKSKLFNWGFTTGKGSGYGLPLIKSMIEIYGWTIEEEGEPRKGARFVMTIPNTQFAIRARNSAR
jgi:signal transduction histidine kinase